MTNTFDFTLTQVVITDAIPMGTTFAWASGNYTWTGGGSVELPRPVVTWTIASLPSRTALTATLAITVGSLLPGSHVINAAYGVDASELSSPVMGTPVAVLVAWRCALPVVLRDWSLGERGLGGPQTVPGQQ